MAKGGKLRVARLERSPVHLLHGALQLALDDYAIALEAEPPAEVPLTQRQFAVLAAAAEREGLSQTELVRATGVDRSTLADMVGRMITKGWLSRVRSVADARANTVSITDAGRAALEAVAPRVEAADARLLALLSAGKRDGFVNQLRTLAKASRAAAVGDSSAGGLRAPAEDSRKKSKAKSAEKLAKAEKKRLKKARKSAEHAIPDDAVTEDEVMSAAEPLAPAVEPALSDLDVDERAGTEQPPTHRSLSPGRRRRTKAAA